MPYPARDKGNRTTPMSVRFTVSERQRVQAAAGAAGISAGEYIRRRALGQPVHALADVAAMSQLRSFGGLLKHLHAQGLGHDERTAQLLGDIERALARIGA